jgi:hypothetical protein
MPIIRTRSTASVLVLAAAAALVLPACGLNLSLDAEAKDQWKKTYTLAAGGTFEIRNTNGKIDIQPADGTTVDVVADRVAKAATDEGARDALRRIEIKESASPDHVTLDSSGGGFNLEINTSRRVDYTVRLPKGVNVKLVSTNGDLQITGVTGTFDAEATNGRIHAESLENDISVRTTNGAISIDASKLGEHGITCSTTNGAMTVSIPKDAKASISASVTNGTIATDGLTLNSTDSTRRHLDASLNGGGAKIHLDTTNGMISIKGR